MNPAARIKIKFDDWLMPTSGYGCDTTYLEVMDGAGIVDENGHKKTTSSFKLCGKNPGLAFAVTI